MHVFDVGYGILDDREGAQSQEVHFDQADALDLFALELHDVQIGVLGDSHRSEILQVVLPDDYAAGMHTGLPNRAFELFGVFERIADQLVRGFPFGGQFRRLLVAEVERRFSGLLVGRNLVGYQFGQPVALREGQLLHAGHVADRQLGRHRTERHDLGHAFLPVLVHAVMQHVVAAVLVEIDIDIRQGDTLGIQETLEQQVVFQRIYVGNFQTVGHDRSGCRTTARSDRHAHFASRADIVPYDEEVTRESHPFDRTQFVPDAFLDLFAQFGAIAQVGSFVGQVFQVAELFGRHQLFAALLALLRPGIEFFDAVAGIDSRQLFLIFDLLDERFAQLLERHVELRRRREVGHQRRMGEFVLLDLVGDLERGGECLGVVGEELRHLLGRFQILLERIAHPVGIVQVAAGIEADQMIVRHGVFGQNEMHVVRADVFDSAFGRQLQQGLIDQQLILVHVGVLARVTRRMELQLQVIVVPEDALEPAHDLFSLLHVVAHDGLGNFAAQTCRAADQSFVVLFQQFLVDTGLVIESFGKGVGDDLAEIVVTREVLGQQNQVIARLLVLVLFEAVAHDVGFAPQNRLDARIGGDVVEVLDAVHIAVVGNGQSLHTEGFGSFDERRYGRCAVQDGILRMYV